MCNALASLRNLTDCLEAMKAVHEHHAKMAHEAAPGLLREQIRIIKTELRSMRRMLANKTKYDPARYALEDQISIIERDLRIRRWESKKIRAMGA